MAIVSVIKYNGKPNEMAWKYPNEKLGTWTQVVVNETQEVIFVKEGKIYDTLGPGRHTLTTDNIPLLSKIINLPFGGKSPFTAEIWYVNKIYVLDIKWGTAPPIQLQDPKYNIFLPVTAIGQFGIRVNQSDLFLKKLVGTLSKFDHETMTNYFRGLIVSNVKNIISGYLIKKNVSILEINAYISEISEEIKIKIKPEMEKYGLELVNFYVTSIEAPEEDSSVIKLKEALSKKTEMNIIGFDYSTERSFNTLENAAKNESNNNFINAGVGLGMGLGLGKEFANQAYNISSNLNGIQKKCNKCGNLIKENDKYCSICGAYQIQECPNCKIKLEENFKYCPKCGKNIIGD